MKFQIALRSGISILVDKFSILLVKATSGDPEFGRDFTVPVLCGSVLATAYGGVCAAHVVPHVE